MKKSLMFPNLFYIIIIMLLLTSCESKDIDNSIDKPLNHLDSITTKPYTYQLPKNSQNLVWEYDNIVCDVEFSSLNLSYYVTDYLNTIIPNNICIMIENLLIASLDKSLSYNGNFYEHAYLATIEYFTYDLDNDGLTDYLVKGIVGVRGSGGGAGQYASAIYIAQDNGTYKEIACALDYNISIMEAMTNGVHDILTGYLGNDICKFDGVDSYTIPYRSNNLFYTEPEIFNYIAKFSFTLDADIEIVPNDKFYVLIYSNDKRLKNNILCSSDEWGNPKTYTNTDIQFGGDIDFYAEVIDHDINGGTGCIDFKQLKFLPVLQSR